MLLLIFCEATALAQWFAQSQRENLLQKEQLAHSEKLVTIGTLTAGVAHEINNPNNALMLSLQSHEQTWKELQPVLDAYAGEHGDFEVGGYLYSELKEEMPESLHRASMNSERIKQIVEDLRSFARKDEGVLSEDVNINTVVENSLVLVGNVIRKKTRNLKITLGGNIPTVKG
ncbi:MAG: histidine kinase, partial [bacterium]|nr:histidine kinase [bacterium]